MAYPCFCFFSEKENGRAERTVHICDKAAGGRFAQGAEVVWFILNHPTLSTADDDGGTRRCQGIVWRLPQEPHPPRRAHDPTKEGYHRLLRRW